MAMTHFECLPAGIAAQHIGHAIAMGLHQVGTIIHTGRRHIKSYSHSIFAFTNAPATGAVHGCLMLVVVFGGWMVNHTWNHAHHV